MIPVYDVTPVPGRSGNAYVHVKDNGIIFPIEDNATTLARIVAGKMLAVGLFAMLFLKKTSMVGAECGKSFSRSVYVYKHEANLLRYMASEEVMMQFYSSPVIPYQPNA